MANTKRKWRWSSKSLFGSKASNKVIILEHASLNTLADARELSAIHMSLDGCSAEDVRHMMGVGAKMRRNGSKLLSIVGLQRSSGAQLNKAPPNSPTERDVALAIVKDAANSSSTVSPRNSYSDFALKQADLQSGTKSGVGLVQEIPSTRLPPPGEIQKPHATCPNNANILHKSIQSQLVSASPLSKSRKTPGLRQSKSSSNFIHQLHHKLSSSFGNPTLVHRPNLRARPALPSTQEDPTPSTGRPSDLGVSPQQSTPSSYNYSGSVSIGEPSTGKTSLESNVASLRSPKALDLNDRPNSTSVSVVAKDPSREQALAPIEEAPLLVTPTVVTVELTANAKVFFETYFNSLLAGHTSPRELRRNELELRIASQCMSEEQRERERSAWTAIESEHLRHTRVLKTKTNKMSQRSGVAIAGYEVVRILGKGSFGVVRLVREKDSAQNSPSMTGSSLPTVPVRTDAAPEGSVNLRTTAIEALRATLEGQKTSQRMSIQNTRREVYAMKVIRKSEMLRNCQEGHLRAERDFLVASENSRWVVPLMASFQDSTNLYLVMEYMVGGDFLGLLFRKDTLREKHARWYIAEMILCVEEAHRLRWIHRDVKPDNFLITASGHLKISDFGLAFDGHWSHDQQYFKNHRQSLMEKLGIEVKGDPQDQEEDTSKEAKGHLASILTGRRGRYENEKAQVDGPSEREPILQWRNRHGKRRLAVSVVGTSQYMAPEVIRGDPYDGRCDWWSIGIILYESLYGFTPFVCDKREDTKQKILNNAKTLIFPDEREVGRKEKISYEAMELINSLLQEKEHRLCSTKYRCNDYVHSKRSPGQLVTRRADPSVQDYQGNYVYPEDATDIKNHRFFKHVTWDRLHLTRPPFVPDVSSRDDTKYFDEDEPISDVDDAATVSDNQGSDYEMHAVAPGTARVTQVDGAQGPNDGGIQIKASNGGKCSPKAKEKKRPRDKVLRDKEVGRKVLDIRKHGAFIGYTYRRRQPLGLGLGLELERGRSRSRGARRSLIPNFE